MKTLKWDQLPKCDFCKKTTDPMYDVPILYGKSWAHMCINCFPIERSISYEIGFKIVKKKPSSNTNISTKEREKLEKKFSDNFDLDDVETLMDSIQPTACPEGCEVEADGSCSHGFKSISLLLGII